MFVWRPVTSPSSTERPVPQKGELPGSRPAVMWLCKAASMVNGSRGLRGWPSPACVGGLPGTVVEGRGCDVTKEKARRRILRNVSLRAQVLVMACLNEERDVASKTRLYDRRLALCLALAQGASRGLA